ncbi:MAG: energy transducer TonB [Bacteroidota bacterium]|nr:energy transducer TonB [Bacteroidota bacterium]
MKNYIYSLIVLLLLCGVAPVRAQKMRTTKWESGMLEKRQKVGVWEYYGITASKEMVVVQRYDHTNKQLVFFRPSGDLNFNTETAPGQWKRRTVDRPPLFIGGDAAMANYTTQLQYPQQAQDRNIQGQVVIGFTVGTDGKATDHHVLRGIGGGCDQEALRVAKTIPDEWVPAQVEGKDVTAEYELTLTFRLAQ